MEDGIRELWREARRLLDQAIEDTVSGLPEAGAVEAARYITGGGKRFRGFLVIVVCRALGGTVEDALEAAVAVELVHASSLALDDIIDADLYRRGKPSSWLTEGVSKTVMVSNLLVPMAQEIVYKAYGDKALALTVRAWLDTSRGEVLDAFTGDADYLETVRLKTGALFRLAAQLGAVAAGAWRLVEDLGGYGELLGIAYQVADDTVDLALGRDTQGARMLVSWLGTRSIDKAVDAAYSYAARASEVAEKLTGCSVLREIPFFMVKAMLREAGLGGNSG